MSENQHTCMGQILSMPTNGSEENKEAKASVSLKTPLKIVRIPRKKDTLPPHCRQKILSTQQQNHRHNVSSLFHPRIEGPIPFEFQGELTVNERKTCLSMLLNAGEKLENIMLGSITVNRNMTNLIDPQGPALLGINFSTTDGKRKHFGFDPISKKKVYPRD